MATGKLNTKLDASQVVREVFDADSESIKVKAVGGTLVPDTFDAIDLTYNGNGDVATATYKLSGNTIATLTLSYNGLFQLTGVVKS